MPLDRYLINNIRGSNPRCEAARTCQRVDSNSRNGSHGCRRSYPPMITPTLLYARSLDESGAGIPYAGIREGGVGRPAVLP